jgi:hypothetical protein
MNTKLMQDRYSEGNLMPKIDDRQDWILLESSENSSHTMLRFTRLLATCDSQDVKIKVSINPVSQYEY